MIRRWRLGWVPSSIRHRPLWVRLAWIASNPVAASPLWRVPLVRRALVRYAEWLRGR